MTHLFRTRRKGESVSACRLTTCLGLQILSGREFEYFITERKRVKTTNTLRQMMTHRICDYLKLWRNIIELVKNNAPFCTVIGFYVGLRLTSSRDAGLHLDDYYLINESYKCIVIAL